MTYYLTIEHRNGSLILDEVPFPSLQEALDYIFVADYLKAPTGPLHNNAYICVGENGISHIHISTTTAGPRNLGPGVRSISIMNEDARLQAAEGPAKGETSH